MAQTTLFPYLAPKPSSNDEIHLKENKAVQTSVRTNGAGKAEVMTLKRSLSTGHKQNADKTVERLHNSVHVSSVSGTCIAQVEPSHLDSIKQLTSTTLPMRYPDKFYDEVTANQEAGDFTRVALFEGKPIGWIRCRIESSTASGMPTQGTSICQIYIQALCLLAPYRQRGLACQLLQEVTRPEALRQHGVTSIYAHVWENNEDALEWYDRRGFKRVLLVDQYYRRLRPSGAWVVRKELE